MVFKLISHNRKEFWRSPFLNEKLLEIFFKVLLVAWLSSSVLSTIFEAHFQLKAGNDIAAKTIGAGILVYLFAEILFRSLFQSFPKMNLVPYLALPVGKTTILKSFLIRSFLTPFFWLPFIFLAFANIFIFKYFPSQIFLFNALIISGVLLNHSFAYFLKIMQAKKNTLNYLFLATLMIAFSLHYFKIIDGFQLLERTFALILKFSIVIFIPFLLAGLSYYSLFKMREVIFEQNTSASIHARRLPIQFFSRFGEIGKQIDFELNMLTRLKAMISQFTIGLLFLIYPFIVKANLTDSSIFLAVVGIFSTYIIPMVSFITFSWHTYHFEALDFYQSPAIIIKAKYYTYGLIGLLFLILGIIVYSFYQPKLIPYTIVGFAYNFTFLLPLMLYLGIKYLKPKEPYQLSWMNSSMGFEAEVLIFSIVIFLGIMIPFLLSKWFLGDDKYGLFVLIAVCIILFAFRNRFFESLAREYKKRKYQNFYKYKSFRQ